MKDKLFLILIIGFVVPLQSKVFITPEEALKSIFPDAQFEKKRIYLTGEQNQNIEKELGFKNHHRFFSFYVARKDQKIIGYAILHTEKVRTQDMSLMFFLNTEFEIFDIILISFFEPLEYRPPERWLKLFLHKDKSKQLIPGIDIPAISGATLTARVVSQMARLTLKLTEFL